MNEIIATAASTLAATAAFFAAWAAYQAAKRTREATEAQVIFPAMTEYFDAEMADAIRTLYRWRRTHGDSFATTWAKEFFCKLEPSGDAIAVDRAKRHVKRYFARAARLSMYGHIDITALKAIAQVHGINAYFDIVVPLDLAQNPDLDRTTDTFLEQRVGRFESDAPRF